MRILNKPVVPTEYQNTAFPLNGGLDFRTNKLQAPQGSLVDCLNYEVIDGSGYQSISGFDRFDGRVSPTQQEFWVVPVTSGVGLSAGLTMITVGTDSVPSAAFGVIAAVETIEAVEYVIYARLNQDKEPRDGESFTVGTSGSGVFDDDPIPYSEFLLEQNPSYKVSDILGEFSTLSGVLRDRIEALPTQPIGLHWYRDRLYAVADEQRLFFNSGGTTEIFPNTILYQSGTRFLGIVLDVILQSGSWAAGTAEGVFLIESLGFENGTGFDDPKPVPTSGNLDILDTTNLPNIATPVVSNAVTARAGVAGDAEARFAGLWRFNNERDMVNPLSAVGPERLQLGWELDYVDGSSSSNDLRKIERSVDNNFEYKESSKEGASIAFINGVVLPDDLPVGGTLGVTVGSVTTGSPGWRDTNALAVFAQDGEALNAVDTRYLIGDAPWTIRYNTGAGEPLMEPLGNAGVYGAGYDAFSAGGRYGATTWAVAGVVNNALVANSRAPLMFLDLGEIMAQLPNDARITGVGVDIDYNVLAQWKGTLESDNTSVNAAVVDTISDSFYLSAYLGTYDSTSNAFQTKGAKQQIKQALSGTIGDYTISENTVGSATVIQGVDSVTGLSGEIGGNNNTWGLTEFEREDFLNTQFGLALFAEQVGTPGIAVNGTWDTNSISGFASIQGITRTSLNKVTLKIYYVEPSARYFIADAGDYTQVISVDLVDYSVTAGELRTSNAEGRFQFTNIQTVDGTKRTVFKGDTIHLADPPTDANKIAIVDDADGADTGDVGMVLNGLPSFKDIVESNSRYQFITANFFAREDWDGFYGVSGAGNAFSFADFDPNESGTSTPYLKKITTNTIDTENDKPRHIAFHNFHLALGFRDGTVRFSVPGEPENFSGVDGAGEVGVGDKVTGLLSMRGYSLAVGCENSIHQIVGSSVDNLTASVLSPYTGVIEYTMVDMGIPVYCDSQGIKTLSQTAAYGNFLEGRLSSAVTPWIVPRMVRSSDLFSLSEGAGVVCAVPVRSKNQYRVFFRDGEVLVMSINSDQTIAFTFSQYYIGDAGARAATGAFFVPLCHSSQIDDNGRERIHMAHYSPYSTITEEASRFVYEFERGWGFDGGWFPAYFATNWMYIDPYTEKTIKSQRADGLTKGYSNVKLSIATDYDPSTYTVNAQTISLPKVEGTVIEPDFFPTYAKADAVKRGLNFSFKFEKQNDSLVGPPHVYQALILNVEDGGKKTA